MRMAWGLLARQGCFLNLCGSGRRLPYKVCRFRRPRGLLSPRWRVRNSRPLRKLGRGGWAGHSAGQSAELVQAPPVRILKEGLAGKKAIGAVLRPREPQGRIFPCRAARSSRTVFLGRRPGLQEVLGPRGGRSRELRRADGISRETPGAPSFRGLPVLLALLRAGKACDQAILWNCLGRRENRSGRPLGRERLDPPASRPPWAPLGFLSQLLRAPRALQAPRARSPLPPPLSCSARRPSAPCSSLTRPL